MNEYWLMYLLTRLPVIAIVASIGVAVLVCLLIIFVTYAVFKWLDDDWDEGEASRLRRACKPVCILLIVCVFVAIALPSSTDLATIAVGGLMLEGKDDVAAKVEKLSTLLDIKLDTFIDKAKAQAVKVEE